MIHDPEPTGIPQEPYLQCPVLLGQLLSGQLLLPQQGAQAGEGRGDHGLQHLCARHKKKVGVIASLSGR